MPSLGSSNVWFTIGAVLAAFPFAYLLGLLVAILIWGPTALGPVLIIVPAIFAAIAFAAAPILAPRTRFAILAVGSVVLFLIGKQFAGF